MHFLTEDDIRARCPNPGCSLTLAANERLTPSAAEFATQMRVAIVQGGASVPCKTPSSPAEQCRAPQAISRAASPECAEAVTHLDAATVVPKSHPRIMLRGKLDTLLAATVMVQTQFDQKNKLSPYLKECLAGIADWVMCILGAEVSGAACAFGGVGGMDADTLHAISRDPKHYLGLDPFMPSAAMGSNSAFLNWLRALVRETEVAAAQSGLGRVDIAQSLNRLSSAVYVITLLTLAAENGVDVTKIGRK